MSAVEQTLDRMGGLGVTAVLRGSDPEQVAGAARALADGGLTVIEVTFTVPDAPRLITELCRDERLLVGAGTVLDDAQARAALDAGARFLVSPVGPRGLVELAAEAGVLCVPGAMTPSEIVGLLERGAQAVKVFPVGSLGGTDYLRHLSGPLPGLDVMVSGGVGLADVAAYRQAGAWSVGLGSSLLAGDPRANAVAAVRDARR